MEYGNGEKNQLVWKSTDNKYHNEHFDADENNINVNVSMLSKYVSKEDIVLDIGCGEGKFGEIVAQKGCNLWGVDIDQTACKETEARGKYKKVFCFNIEHPEQNDGDYDEFKNLNILFENDINALVEKSNYDTEIVPDVELNELKAPITKGSVVGKVSYTVLRY